MSVCFCCCWFLCFLILSFLRFFLYYRHFLRLFLFMTKVASIGTRRLKIFTNLFAFVVVDTWIWWYECTYVHIVRFMLLHIGCVRWRWYWRRCLCGRVAVASELSPWNMQSVKREDSVQRRRAGKKKVR